MPQLKKSFTAGRMNKDADERLLPPGEYRHGENINVINSETSENSGTVKNVLSNKKLTNFSFTAPVYNITPNPLVYEAKNRVYWLVKDGAGCYLIEYNINNQTISFVLTDTRPLATRVLKLSEKHLVTGINILKTEDEDKELILWTDNNMQPCCVNIKRAKTWAPNQFEEEDILLIKKPPLYAPKITPVYSNDKSNNLENKFLSFSYRYKYLDGEYSALSSYSNHNFSPKEFELDFFTLVNKGFVNKFNAAKIEFNTGDHRVVEIQLAVKESRSNTIYIIETFNKAKEGIGDNEVKSFIFSNQKIYTALQENELYRLFDNVPLKAKAQTLINNYLSYGNYVEFFNIKDQNGNDIVIDFDVSLKSTNIDTSIDLLMAFPTSNTFTFQNAAGIQYKKDYVLSFFFSVNINDILVYKNEFYFLLPIDYATLNDLVTSTDFVNFIEIIKNHFASNYNSNNEYEVDPDYAINTDTSIEFSIVSGVPTFTVNPIIFEDTANSNAIVNVDLSFNDDTVVGISSILNTTSCKSNKNYQVGIEYIYKYNRATTALTSKNNTLFIPQEFSIFKNQLRITMNSLPPIDAERYKFVVKTNPLQYQTIYINEFYNEDNYVWAKLQADNKDKVKIGDTLNLKTGGDILGTQPSQIKVLDLKEFDKDFIADNKDQNGNDIIETAGFYMKIRPEGFSMDLNDYRINQNKIGDMGSSGYPYCYLDLFTQTNFTTIDSELSLGQGSSVYIMINSSFKFDAGWKNVRFEKTFYTQRNYATIQEWFEENLLNGNYIPGIDLRNGDSENYAENLSLVRGKAETISGLKIQTFTPNPNGKLYLKVKGLIDGGSNNRKGYCRAEIVVRNSTGIYVFETQPTQADSEIFFETEETFDIVNGEHHGSAQYPIVQNQDKATMQPAIIDLNFFNCYAQGNGVESYRVRDEFNANALNIDLRPTAVSIEPYKQVHKFADVTHSSEPYNESSNINGLNNFNLATANFKELDKQYGSVQLLHNKENDILIIQEEKAGKILFGKDAIYTAEGEPIITKISEVLGKYDPYQGNNGIGLNPESFAKDNYRYYWFNTYFGTPIRLSIDGTTEINYGMQSFFRNLAISHRNAIKIGGFDTFNKLYTLSIGDEPVIPNEFNCGNSFSRTITAPFSYTLNLNNQVGEIVLNYNIPSGNVTITTVFNGTSETHEDLTGAGSITIDRDTLDQNELFVTITPNDTPSLVQITNVCPLPTPLEIVLVVLGDELDAGKTILNRFRANLNSFFQHEDTFSEDAITKFETISGYEGQALFPTNGDTITIQSVKRQFNTGSFLKLEECNKIKYLVSNQPYDSSTVNDLLSDSTDLVLTETIQGPDQNTFSGSFEFNRAATDEKLYLIWDYTNRKPVANNDSISMISGGVRNINVLSNDIQNGNVTVTIIEPPVNGTAVVNLDNTITYTNSGNEETTDAIVYQISNGTCQATATVFIAIDGIITPEPTEIMFALRSNIISTPETGCAAELLTNCKVATLVPTMAIETGNRVYNSDDSPFNGGGNYYKIQSLIADSSDPSYICQVDINGYITLHSTCI